MARGRTQYVCQECSHVSPNWLGRCPHCEGWNTFTEEAVHATKGTAVERTTRSIAVPVSQIAAQAGARLSTGIPELDRVLGGGLVAGSVVLVGGDPGIGKSTLLTQSAFLVAAQGSGVPVLYVSGEESGYQIRLRCERLHAMSDHLLVVNETDVDVVLGQVAATKPQMVVIDSIQTASSSELDSVPGTVSQVRHCAALLTRVAKTQGVPVVLVGHVTKEGSLAGPRVLEHMVDTVLYFEGDRTHAYRVLRAVKNRFGSTNEIGLFEMQGEGLVGVENASAALLAERSPDATGSSVGAIVEGTRPRLVEVQALVTHSFLSTPRRTANGLDYNRLTMLLAVLEKRMGLRLGDQDVYLNIAGGVRVMEPAADLAAVAAVAGSFREAAIESHTVLIGEVGLGGEIRDVPHLDRRLAEASRMGFTRAVIAPPRAGRARQAGMELVYARNVEEALRHALVAHGHRRSHE